MKLIYTLLLWIVTFSIQAQETDLLETTWFLRYLQIDGERTYTPISDGFTLEISESSGDFDLYAFADTNSFQANVTFDTDMLSFITSDVGTTVLDCGDHCDYENLYITSFLTDTSFINKEFFYDFDTFSQGRKSLRLTDQNNNQAYYTNEPISIDQDLFSAWYLFRQDVDLGEPTFFDPSEDRSLTINEDLTFTGTDFCVDYSGTFIYGEDFVVDFLLEMETYNRNTEDCDGDTDPGTAFEDFGEGQIFRATLDENNGDGILTLEATAGFTMHFSQNLLSTPEISQTTIRLYPNPASQYILVETGSESLKSTEVIDLYGHRVPMAKVESLSRFDVSQLSVGIYFLKIETNSGTFLKRFVKL